jgi:hypothetical protein
MLGSLNSIGPCLLLLLLLQCQPVSLYAARVLLQPPLHC